MDNEEVMKATLPMLQGQEDTALKAAHTTKAREGNDEGQTVQSGQLRQCGA